MVELVETVTVKQSEYDRVVVMIPIPAPHIFFLFHTKYAPQRLVGNNANNIDNIYFVSDLSGLEPEFYEKHTLLVTAVMQHPREDAVFVLKNLENKALWQGYELKIDN